MLRLGGGDDSTCLTLLCVHSAAGGTCVGLDVAPPGSGANADVAVASGLFDEQSDGRCCTLVSLYRGGSWMRGCYQRPSCRTKAFNVNPLIEAIPAMHR